MRGIKDKMIPITQTFQIRHRAVLCPVCNGKGKVMEQGYKCGNKTCHGCNGKGWVEVRN